MTAGRPSVDNRPVEDILRQSATFDEAVDCLLRQRPDEPAEKIWKLLEWAIEEVSSASCDTDWFAEIATKPDLCLLAESLEDDPEFEKMVHDLMDLMDRELSEEEFLKETARRYGRRPAREVYIATAMAEAQSRAMDAQYDFETQALDGMMALVGPIMSKDHTLMLGDVLSRMAAEGNRKAAVYAAMIDGKGLLVPADS